MATASKPEDTPDDDLIKRCSLAHSITVQLEAAARANAKLDIRDRKNLSVVGNYLALLAVGLAAPEARGVLARMTRELNRKDVKSALMVAFVESAMRDPEHEEAAQNLLFWLSTKVDKSWGKLSVETVATLLRRPGRKGPVATAAALNKMLGEAGDEQQIAKNLDKARLALRNRDDKKNKDGKKKNR